MVTIGKAKLKWDLVTGHRGGDRMVENYADKRDRISAFISQLRVSESHYNRKKTGRVYLPSNTNIKQLTSAYNSTVSDNLKAEYGLFRRIFSDEFNIGFGSSAIDTCSFCDRVCDSIEYENKNKNLSAAQNLTRDLKIHRAQAKCWFQLMKEMPPSTVTFCFDLQQVHYLPCIPISETFYKRQLSYYCFCVTDPKMKSPTFYRWLETEAQRGSEEIASALITHLQSMKSTWSKRDLTTIRLFCDGCGGQNKNKHMMPSIAHWLDNTALDFPNVKKVVFYFPVRGLSFIPCDRIRNC